MLYVVFVLGTVLGALTLRYSALAVIKNNVKGFSGFCSVFLQSIFENCSKIVNVKAPGTNFLANFQYDPHFLQCLRKKRYAIRKRNDLCVDTVDF